MTYYSHAGIYITGVVPMDMAKCPAHSARVARYRDDVNVVGHQAIGPDLHSVPFGGVCQQIKIRRVIAVFEECPCAPVAALRHSVVLAFTHLSAQFPPGIT